MRHILKSEEIAESVLEYNAQTMESPQKSQVSALCQRTLRYFPCAHRASSCFSRNRARNGSCSIATLTHQKVKHVKKFRETEHPRIIYISYSE